LQGEATIVVGDGSLSDAQAVAAEVEAELREHLHTLDTVTVTPVAR
jgi:hypothetical protein